MDDYIDKVVEIICNRIYAGQNDIENQELGELTKTLVELINAKANLNSSKRMFEGSEQDDDKVLSLKKKVTDLEEKLENQSLIVEILFEFARSVANKDKTSLLSYQQLHSPSPDSRKKVRMLFQQIREQYDELEHLRGADDAKKNNNISSGLEVKLNVGNLSQSNSDDIFWIHEKILELLGRSISSN